MKNGKLVKWYNGKSLVRLLFIVAKLIRIFLFTNYFTNYISVDNLDQRTILNATRLEGRDGTVSLRSMQFTIANAICFFVVSSYLIERTNP